jgi:SAM-dependent methyltransferase
MSLYDTLLGIPFVYDRVRPLVVGGIDLSPMYSRLQAQPSSVVLDLGCGTGDALHYVQHFASYVGFDVDPMAVRSARRRFGGRESVRFEARLCTRADVDSIAPTHVVLAGLLHHLIDHDALEIFRLVQASPRLARVVTLDPVYVPGAHLNNLLVRLDRGKFGRDAEGYAALARRSGLTLRESLIAESRPEGGRAKYFVMALER